MVIRIQIRLTEQQSRRLKVLAKRHRVSVSELVRRAVDRASEADLVPEIRARARQVIGKYADTASDVSEEHDRYLAEALEA